MKTDDALMELITESDVDNAEKATESILCVECPFSEEFKDCASCPLYLHARDAILLSLAIARDTAQGLKRAQSEDEQCKVVDELFERGL